MRKWFRVGLVALAIALGVWAYTLQPPKDVAVPPTAETTAGDIAAGVLTNALRNGGALSDVDVTWRVTQANSTVDVMVIDVEAERPEDALAIAEEVVAPLADSYVEVVIYVRGRDLTDDDSVRRVQWTPDTGYVETTYSDR
jgi:hypothetical protein